ncbi:MAG: GNAT family N-acetyltransferase [Chloroflexi bacterium]|nr:GNAT family N-acetyltransferase [Chloroflexota bacterium]
MTDHSSENPLPGTPARPRQLQMLRPHLDHLPDIDVPPGFLLRTWQDGDEVAWGAIMDSPGGIHTSGGWLVHRVREKLIDRAEFTPSGCFLICDTTTPHQIPVASATMWRVATAGHPARGYLHMVGALPDYRGRGLGRAVSLAALMVMASRGDTDAMLETDDFRIAAVRSYLALGFTPVYAPDGDRGPDHRHRWSAVLRECHGMRSALP